MQSILFCNENLKIPEASWILEGKNVLERHLKTTIGEVNNHQRNLIYVTVLCSMTTSWKVFYHIAMYKSEIYESREDLFHL